MGHGSLRSAILKLHETGLPQSQIAVELGCTPANVSRHLKQYRRRYDFDGSIAPLTQPMLDKLAALAAQSNVAPAEMARALLIDALDEV